MFSIIGQYIGPNKNRETEKTDTHEYIRPHQRDDGKRKKGGHGENEQLLADDLTSVSVEALYTFLENFLTDQINSAKEPEIKSFLDNMETMTKMAPPKIKKPQNAAINAYQHAAETSPENKTKKIEHKNINENDLIDNQDMQAIYALLTDLELLKEHNVEILNIQRGETFLDSLKISVEMAKSQISSA